MSKKSRPNSPSGNPDPHLIKRSIRRRVRVLYIILLLLSSLIVGQLVLTMVGPNAAPLRNLSEARCYTYRPVEGSRGNIYDRNGEFIKAMEATGFGAWMAGRSEEEFCEALSRLVAAPTQDHPDYLTASFSILRDYPQTEYANLSIPTWLYGHEWTSPFSTHIAKLFANSVREDTLLTIAYGGIIYAPDVPGLYKRYSRKRYKITIWPLVSQAQWSFLTHRSGQKLCPSTLSLLNWWTRDFTRTYVSHLPTKQKM